MNRPSGRSGLSSRTVLAVGVGNALEFYAFTTFAYFAIQIGHTFFPPDSTHGLLYTLATFGVGFLTRPLGAFFIGRYADRVERTGAMLAALTLMGLGILGIALTPGYARIGVAAPILLVCFRLVQGFAVGGEVGPSTAYLAESGPPERRGLYVALQLASQYAAGMASGLVGFVLSEMLSKAQLQDWGWRIALLLGIAVVPAGLYIRYRLPESAYRGAALSDERQVGTGLLARYVIVMAAGTTCVYVVDYMNTYAQDTLKLGAHIGFGATIVESLTVMAVAPFGGTLSDRFGRKPVILSAIAALVLAVVPAYWAMLTWRTPAVVFAMTAVLASVEALMGTSVITMVIESMPRAKRASLFGILYAVVVAVFGGFAQFIVKSLIELTGSALAPAAYLVFVLIIAAAALLGASETAPIKVHSQRRTLSA